MLVYVDTDIFLNYLLNRKNKLGRSLYPEAALFFQRVYSGDFKILISNKTLEELYANIELEQTRMLFEFLKDKIQKVNYTPEEVAEAKSIDPIDWKDALHALLARKHEASCLITRNMRHFKKFSHIIQPKFPCEL